MNELTGDDCIVCGTPRDLDLHDENKCNWVVANWKPTGLMLDGDDYGIDPSIKSRWKEDES